MKLVVDWVSAPVGGTSVQTQLITSAVIDNASISSALTAIDFGVQSVAMFFSGYHAPDHGAAAFFILAPILEPADHHDRDDDARRLCVAWLGLDVGIRRVLGYANGIPIK